MTNIYRKTGGRVSVTDAKRLIVDAMPPEPAVQIWEAQDGALEAREVPDGGFRRARIDAAFSGACATLGIAPRHRYEPTRTDYAGASWLQDVLYTITQEEFARFAGLYDLTVTVGSHQAPAEPVPPALIATKAPDAAPPVGAESVPEASGLLHIKPLARWEAQERTILAKLRELGFSPSALPKSGAWRPGVKAAVRAAIGKQGMWQSPKVFDKAWERLRDVGEIADKS